MVQNVPPAQVWEALRSDPTSVLIDVRTDAEWNYVGLADLSSIGKDVVLLSWQAYPAMQVNAQFGAQLHQAGLQQAQKLYFICRSGVRSLAAAQAAQAAGFPNSFNVADGFEGPLDAEGHRGSAGGWKAENLPWRQR
jgi:rhodanese-related sulfurtransferase